MGSRKRTALRRQREEFLGGLGGMDDVFDRETIRSQQLDDRRDAIMERKACTSKQRYANRREAEAAIEDCAAHGTYGLHCYRCPYCHGWHLTSHPRSAS